jgi:RNA polymerase sigma-70 factor (ECF subfamily)
MSAAHLRIVRSNAEVLDAELLARIARRELDALGLLYDRYAPQLLRYAARVDREAAEDIVQTVFLRVTDIAARYDETAPSARPWLFAITTRVVQERRRALRRAAAAMLRFGRHGERRWTATEDLRSDMDRSLARLSVAKRTVLVLAEVEGFSCDEIARMLEVPVGTVWTRLHHARRELRRLYEEQSR